MGHDSLFCDKIKKKNNKMMIKILLTDRNIKTMIIALSFNESRTHQRPL
jgi:hypothetical protein